MLVAAYQDKSAAHGVVPKWAETLCGKANNLFRHLLSSIFNLSPLGGKGMEAWVIPKALGYVS